LPLATAQVVEKILNPEPMGKIHGQNPIVYGVKLTMQD
jgi:hypothetical protein